MRFVVPRSWANFFAVGEYIRAWARASSRLIAKVLDHNLHRVRAFLDHGSNGSAGVGGSVTKISTGGHTEAEADRLFAAFLERVLT